MSSSASSAGLDERLLGLAERVASACPSPALVVERGGGLRLVNRAARRLLGVGEDFRGGSSRSLFGVGWREMELIARERDADLLAEVPGDARRRGMRVRLEPVETEGGEMLAAVAFLESAAPARGKRRPGAGRDGFERLFGDDPALQAAKAAGERFAATSLPVLLLAETGTGKELLARALHAASPRRDEPFVAINCGALSPHLLESELFGYAPGAFTGASRQGNDGKIGAARRGTLFLDEVAEMPGPLQSLLLRVLEDGTYYRVGENLPRQADVRLICATCRDLPALVRDGSFRQDLYYRINGACLSLPRVRERTDVEALIQHLLEDLAARQQAEAASGSPDSTQTIPPPIEQSALASLLGYSWPGNVRQLKTALRHALILSGGGPLALEHLPAEVIGRAPSLTAAPALSTPPGELGSAAIPVVSPSAAPARRPTLAEIEAERLRRAVEASGGNLSRAARELGIARTTLYRRLRKHGFLEPAEES